MLGVGRPELRPLLARALSLLGTERAVVVHGDDGLDEVTLSGPTQVTEVPGQRLRKFTWTPEDFGLARQSLASLTVDGPADSAAVIRRILTGERGPARDIVIIDAAAALWTAGHTSDLATAAEAAARAIDSQAAAQLLERLAAESEG